MVAYILLEFTQTTSISKAVFFFTTKFQDHFYLASHSAVGWPINKLLLRRIFPLAFIILTTSGGIPFCSEDLKKQTASRGA